MKEKKLILLTIIIAITIIIVSSVLIIKQNHKYEKQVNIVISELIGKIEEKYPDVKEEEIISILNRSETNFEDGKQILSKYGINIKEISAIEYLENQEKEILIINIASIIIFTVLAIIFIMIYDRNKNKKIKSIIKYIEEINNKNYDLKINENTEDVLSKLTNELYKVTIQLKEQSENSIKDRKALQIAIEDISHQLKTPLTSITIMLDNIQENPNMDSKTKTYFLHEISRQIEWINWLIISLLKSSKLDSNTVIFNKKEIDVRDLINNVIKNLSVPIDIKQQNIIIKGEKSTIIGDYNWQLEAITNIVKNCIEHTPENKNIYINFEENNLYTKITIKDEGIGINKKDLKHIFERFYKGKYSSENSIGIGLALAKSIIEKENGYIICTSKINCGTTFEIKYMKE